MKSRLARFSVLFIPMMALVASMAPPASATEVGALVVVGQANVGQGIAYPCLDGKTTPPTVNPAKCTGHLGANPNKAAVTFSGTGAGTVVKVTKPKCPLVCVEAGTFAITASGSISGACGLSSGVLAGSITPIVSVGTKPAKPRGFNVSYQGIGGLLVVTGNTSKGEILAGAVVALPTTGTCLNKTPKSFTVAGPIFVIDPNIP